MIAVQTENSEHICKRIKKDRNVYFLIVLYLSTLVTGKEKEVAIFKHKLCMEHCDTLFRQNGPNFTKGMYCEWKKARSGKARSCNTKTANLHPT